MFEKLKEYSAYIVMGAIIIILLMFLSRSCTNNKNLERLYNNNIEAINDSITYYKDKTGKLVAEKTMLYGDIETLEVTNKKLSKELKNMKSENADMALQIEAMVQNKQHDTIWENVNDTCFKTHFNFDDEPYRLLSGDIKIDNKQMEMSIDTDIVKLDLVVAAENNMVRIKSNNPYLSFNEVYGITTPEYEPTWCLVIGPSITGGYGAATDFKGGNCGGGLALTAGVSITFGWNVVAIGKRIKKTRINKKQ